MENDTPSLHPPVTTAAEDPAVMDDHRTNGDAALGQAELSFLNRGSHEFFHDALLSVSGPPT
jgi:hypothetical protein